MSAHWLHPKGYVTSHTDAHGFVGYIGTGFGCCKPGKRGFLAVFAGDLLMNSLVELNGVWVYPSALSHDLQMAITDDLAFTCQRGPVSTVRNARWAEDERSDDSGRGLWMVHGQAGVSIRGKPAGWSRVAENPGEHPESLGAVFRRGAEAGYLPGELLWRRRADGDASGPGRNGSFDACCLDLIG